MIIFNKKLTFKRHLAASFSTRLTLFFVGLAVFFLHSCQEREFTNPFDPQVPKTLSTSVLPAGAGKVNVSPGGTSFATDQVVTLIPEPSQHWVFKNWQGDASGSTVPLSLTMSSNKSVVAIFERRNYPLTITVEGEGTVVEKIVFTPSNREYPHSTIVELTPIPKQGWLFDSWSGDLSGKNVPQNITIDNPKTVRVKFVQQQISNLACASALNTGNLVATLPANGVSSAIPYTTVAGGSYVGQSVTSTGVTGLTATLAAGSFSPGSGNLTFTIAGTPSGVGTASFAISIGGQTCTFTRVVNPLGTIAGLNCGAATNNGTLIVGAAASNVNSVIPYTGGNGSAYVGQSINSAGVTGLTATLAPGNFVSGNGTLTYTITGTPSATGNATFALSIGGQTCSLTRVVTTLTGSITELNCGAASSTGVLNANQPASGVSGSIPYAGGNGGVHSGLSVGGSGVSGLTLTINPGSFANGNGTLEYSISGTPFGTGNVSFALIIGGRACTLTRVVNQIAGSISALNCSSAVNSGTLVAGVSASGVGSSVSYSGGNGGLYAGQVVGSTGVTGLTASLAGGTFGNGNGTLEFTITGTPSGNGTASFALNVGGRSCTLTRVVNQASGSIGQLNCSSATNTGTLTQGTAASGASFSVPYSGGNGGSHSGQSVSSSGVGGLTATLVAGAFTNSTGSLTYTITGTPTGSGLATFNLNIGGKTCSFSRDVLASATSGYPANTVLCGGVQAAIVPVINPATGRTWMDRNLGASRLATQSNDPQSYGDLYQWGRRADGHQCRNSATSTVLSSSDTPNNTNFILGSSVTDDWRNPQNPNLWQGVSGTNNPCPSGYRLPTASELSAEVQSWGAAKNSSGAFSSPLKLTTAGARLASDGYLWSAIGSYWTSTVEGNGSITLDIYDNSAATNFYKTDRADGSSVRCIRN